MARSLYRATHDLAHPWARARHDEWDTGNLDAVLTALRGHALHNDEAWTCIDYLERNLARIDYPAFRADGLCPSTGVVEASCKAAIGTRCKRADPRVKPLEVENRRLQRQPYVYSSLYVILDLFSRYVVGWMVATHGNAQHAGGRIVFGPQHRRHSLAAPREQ